MVSDLFSSDSLKVGLVHLYLPYSSTVKELVRYSIAALPHLQKLFLFVAERMATCLFLTCDIQNSVETLRKTCLKLETQSFWCSDHLFTARYLFLQSPFALIPILFNRWNMHHMNMKQLSQCCSWTP